jgi:signal transduction histidine kinase
MAIRYGGRHELEGGMEIMALPAEGIDARDDVAKLQKELDEARKQGQAYARELAAMWSAGEEAVTQSTAPPMPGAAAERHGAVAHLAGGVAATLRAMLSPIGREVGGSGDPAERLEAIRQRLLAVQDFVGELAAIGESDPQEPPRELDLGDLVRHEVRSLEGRAARAGVTVTVATGGDDGPASRVYGRAAPKAAAVAVRALVAHAIGASPRGSTVNVSLAPPRSEEQGPSIVVDDSGTTLPAVARKALLALEVEPGTFGRPSGVALFAAAQIAAAQGGRIEVSDAPSGGLRVSVSFPR